MRVAVRRALSAQRLAGRLGLVACSGGADSLALAAATGFVAPRLGGTAGAVVVDHGLQEDSAQTAAEAAAQCRQLGLEPVEVVRVHVGQTADGPEASARRARHRALAAVAQRTGAAAVLLGHTRDDQAEQVLLGLARGSGTRSLAGMPAVRPLGDPDGRQPREDPDERQPREDPDGRLPREDPDGPLLLRPLLTVPRASTRGACRELGLAPWSDPHNEDPSYARVRARGVLPVLDTELGPGVPAALARTAELLREDAEALEEAARTAYSRLGPLPWSARDLTALPVAVRRRVWRQLALVAGSPPGSLTAEHLRSADALVRHWRGQGPVDLPGGVRLHRQGDLVTLTGPET